MPKLDSNIYGADENSFAEGISSDSLSSTKGKGDIWGSIFDQSAEAKGNAPDPSEAKAVRSTGSLSPKKSEGN